MANFVFGIGERGAHPFPDMEVQEVLMERVCPDRIGRDPRVTGVAQSYAVEVRQFASTMTCVVLCKWGEYVQAGLYAKSLLNIKD